MVCVPGILSVELSQSIQLDSASITASLPLPPVYETLVV